MSFIKLKIKNWAFKSCTQRFCPIAIRQTAAGPFAHQTFSVGSFPKLELGKEPSGIASIPNSRRCDTDGRPVEDEARDRESTWENSNTLHKLTQASVYTYTQSW